MTRKLSRSLVEYDQNLSKNPLEISGRLGIPLGGQRLVQVPTRKAFVYVRLRNNQNELIQAYNNQVAPAYDLPVRVVREGNKYIIAGVDTAQYENNWTSYAPFLPMHGDTHSMTLDGVGGGDPVWVYGRQFMPMLGIPSGSAGGPNLIITEHILRKPLSSEWLHMGNTGTPNLTPYRPTGSTAVMILVYMDSETGNPGILVGSGTPMPATYTGTSQIVPYLPQNHNPLRMVVSAVRLVSGTTVLGWDNIYDVRQYFPPVPTGSSGGLSSVAVQDEGVAKGSVATFNFVGGRVLASVSGSVARIDISPDPSELIGVMGYQGTLAVGTGSSLSVSPDDGFSLSRTGTTLYLNYTLQFPVGIFPAYAQYAGIFFTGSGVQEVSSYVLGDKQYAVVNIPGTVPPVFPQDNIGAMIWDEGVPKGTGTILNFVGAGVDVSISGTVVRVHITGSSGGGGIPSGTVQVFNTGAFVGSADQFDFQHPLAVGITGSRAYPHLLGSLLAYEDVSSQLISGSAVTHFDLSGTVAPGTDRLYYNGLRQKRILHYTVDANGRGFTTLFTGTFTDESDVIVMEYGNLGAQHPQIWNQVDVYDSGPLLGTVQGINFGSNLSVIVSGSIAFVDASASGGGGLAGIPIYASGTFIATGTSFNFIDDLQVSMSGTRADVRVSTRPPRSWTTWHMESWVMVGSGISFTTNSSMLFNVTAQQASPSDGDTWKNWFYVRGGSGYRINITCRKTSDSGKIDFYIDDVLVSSGTDLYSAVDSSAIIGPSGLTISRDGWHSLKGVINGKNASSSGYAAVMTRMVMFVPNGDS